MNFSSFLVKHEKKRKKKLLDDRPFSSMIAADESKQRLLSHARTGHWVNCARVRVDTDHDSEDDEDSKFKSFNHYFVDEPIYSEPDLREEVTGSDNVSDDHDDGVSPLLTMVSLPRGQGWPVSSTDSDYESFSLDRADMEPGRIMDLVFTLCAAPKKMFLLQLFSGF